MGYNIPVLKLLSEIYKAKVHVVHWNHKKLTPYEPPKIDSVKFYNRSDYNRKSLLAFSLRVRPNIVYISGWQDKDYMSTCLKLRKKGVIVVCGFDDQWRGTYRQKIGSLIFKMIGKKIFSHAWVSGYLQFEYARNFGFRPSEIIYNLLSCDIEEFRKAESFLKAKSKSYPKSFLYVGNFRKRKGTDILVEAFKLYREEYKGDWNLLCIGNGTMEKLFELDGIKQRSFLSSKQIVKELRNIGVFILPSRLDQWGVVVHEFATAGLPLILSENVGAKSMFLIEGFNGFTFRNNSSRDLAKKMKLISSLEKQELLKMSQNSINLSKRISPESSAANFMSLLKTSI